MAKSNGAMAHQCNTSAATKGAAANTVPSRGTRSRRKVWSIIPPHPDHINTIRPSTRYACVPTASRAVACPIHHRGGLTPIIRLMPSDTVSRVRP